MATEPLQCSIQNVYRHPAFPRVFTGSRVQGDKGVVLRHQHLYERYRHTVVAEGIFNVKGAENEVAPYIGAKTVRACQAVLLPDIDIPIRVLLRRLAYKTLKRTTPDGAGLAVKPISGSFVPSESAD
jgi:hypothetical protein